VIAADRNNHRIQRFGRDGHFYNAFGVPGSGQGEFAFPSDVGIDGNQNIYVADTMNHRVQKFDRFGTFLLAWGGEGSADGAFLEPRGLNVLPADPGANVLVADTGNHRIQMFTGDGTFRTKWGVQGSGDGAFQGPRDVAAFGRTFDVAVADTGNRRVQLFDLVGFQLDAVFLDGWPAGDAPASIALGSLLNNTTVLYVADEANDLIYRFDATGTLLNSWPVAGRPGGVYWGGGDEVFVANAATNTIQVFSCQ
jgi:DNA-binding beta-propeller fold protein YncE